MYYLNKFVGWIVSPLGILFIGCGIGVALRSVTSRKCQKAGMVFIIAAIAIIWFLSSPISTRIIGLPLEGREEDELNAVQICRCDAVVVLGGGVGVHKQCGRIELFGAADRIWTGVRVWKSYHNDAIKLVIGGGVDESLYPLLADFGIPRDSVLFFPNARNTAEEAKLISTTGFKRIILVTSAWHMSRAKMLFERSGIDIVPAPCDYEMHFVAEHPIRMSDFIPNADCSALCRNSAIIKEFVGLIGYRILQK